MTGPAPDRPEPSGPGSGEALLVSLTEAMSGGVVVVDADGRILRLTNGARDLVGAASAAGPEHVGDLPVRKADGTTFAAGEHPTDRAMAEQRVVVEDVVVPLPGGDRRIVEVRAAPVSGADGGAVAVYRDVTEERRHTELLDSMTEAMTEGLIVVDTDGELVRVNAAARRLLQQTGTGSSTNLYDYDFLRPDGSPLPRAEHPSVRARAEHRAVTEDMAVRLADGRTRLLSVTAIPLTGGMGGDGDRMLKVYRDVTDERSRSRQLADFATTAAHDLRSPLTAVRGWLDLVSAKLEPEAPAERAVGRAREGVDRMQVLITELLAQAVAEGGELTPEPVELGGREGLVAEVAAELQADADGAGRAEILADEALPVVAADHDLLSQLFRNLLGNALKYVDGDRPVRVVVSGHVSGERVVVDVTDNGIGIPPESRELVFERFHRAHAEDARFNGTGLGLALCRTIVERHGGRISAVPAPSGVGTTIRLDLPLASVPAPEAPAPAAL